MADRPVTKYSTWTTVEKSHHFDELSAEYQEIDEKIARLSHDKQNLAYELKQLQEEILWD